jgi:hypothetical protein
LEATAERGVSCGGFPGFWRAKWIDVDAYDIVAKAEGKGDLTERQLLELLRPPCYLLVVRKGGSTFTEAKADGEPAWRFRVGEAY